MYGYFHKGFYAQFTSNVFAHRIDNFQKTYPGLKGALNRLNQHAKPFMKAVNDARNGFIKTGMRAPFSFNIPIDIKMGQHFRINDLWSMQKGKPMLMGAKHFYVVGTVLSIADMGMNFHKAYNSTGETKNHYYTQAFFYGVDIGVGTAALAVVGTSVAAPYVIAGASIYFTIRFGISMYNAYYAEEE